MSAFAFFELPGAEDRRGSPHAPGTLTSPRAPISMQVDLQEDKQACDHCGRPLAGRCYFCSSPDVFVCESCCTVCDGCGQGGCGACTAAHFTKCSACDYVSCDECRDQPGDEDADLGKESGPRGCWCDSERKRDVGNRRFVSRERYKVLQLTHPSMRASSLAACGLQDDDDDDDSWAQTETDDGANGTPQSGAGVSSCVSGGGASGAHAASSCAQRSPCTRHGSMELSSDGGSSIRRSFMRYGALGSRSRNTAL